MSHRGGRRIVVIIRAVEVSYRGIDELIDIHAVQAIDSNCIELAAQVGTFAPNRRSGRHSSDKIDDGRCRVGNQRALLHPPISEKNPLERSHPKVSS